MTTDARLGVRRASLRSALRSGDELAASRAGSRLRLGTAALTREELAAARAARGRLGRAIREARWRKRLAGPAVVAHVSRAEALPRRWPAQAVANVVAGIATIALLVAVLIPRESEAPALVGAAPPEPLPAQVVDARIGGRGRTTTAVSLVAEPTPEPTPAPTASPEPTAAPSAPPPVARSQPRASAPAAAPGATGGAPGGVPGGSPGGVPGGQPGGTGTAAPLPTLRAPLFATPKPTGWGRIMFTVTNGITGAPLSDVCVLIATASCETNQRYTNAFGQWWLDLPPEAATFWRISFALDRFTTRTVEVTYTSGRDLNVGIELYQVR